MKKRILIIVSNASAIGPNNRRTGTFLPEVAHPYAVFDDAGYEIDFASLTGATPFLDALNLADDADNLKFLTGKGWTDMQKAKKLSEVNVNSYDAVFAPGGLAPMVDLPENPLLKKIIAETYERGAVVGAVCHGPVSLLNVKLSDGSYLLKGKNITSFTTEEEDNYARADVPFDLQTVLTSQGAIFHAATPWSDNSIADGRLVTGQNPASARGVGEKIVAILEADQKPVYVFAKWQVKEGQLDKVLQLLGTVAQKSREEKGNLFYKIHQDNTDANTLVLSEGYTDASAVDKHRNSAHFQDLVIAQIVPLLQNREVVAASQPNLV